MEYLIVLIILGVLGGPWIYAALIQARLRKQLFALQSRIAILEALPRKQVPEPAAPTLKHDVPVASSTTATETAKLPSPVAAEEKRHEPIPPYTAKKKAASLEEILGTQWLNKIGVIAVVIGIALFLAYEMRELGPGGKIFIGFAASASLLGSGVFYERRQRYRILARAAVGGGWALTFFTTYAMHHVAASRIISSQVLDLVLMIIVGAAMVIHTLRYDSQVVTALAFLLASSTVAISHDNIFSLTANAILAAGLAVVIVRKRWFELEVFGILTIFLNHFFWLVSTKDRPLLASTALLLVYWAVFRTAYVTRHVKTGAEERISTVAALLNSSMLLGLMRYQSFRPELAFFALLGLGIIELGLGQLPLVRRRREAFIVLSALGATLAVAAIPFRYSQAPLSMLWLVEVEAFFIAGVLLREILFCRFGVIASIAVAIQMVSMDAARICGMRWNAADVSSQPRLAVLFTVAASIFYLNAHWKRSRWTQSAANSLDAFGYRLVSWWASLLLALAAWLLFSESWTAVGWAVLCLAVALVARRLAIPDMQFQACAIAAFTVVRALKINIADSGTTHGITMRLMTVPFIALLLYVFSEHAEFPAFIEWKLLQAFSWSATTLATLLIWYELQPLSVALGWMLAGMVLFELGISRNNLHLRLQAYVALTFSFLRVFIVNLNADSAAAQISPRLYASAPLVLAYFYVYRRLQTAGGKSLDRDRSCFAPQTFSFLGTLTIAALMRFEMDSDWVIAAWSLLAFVLVVAAWKGKEVTLLHQAFVTGLLILFRGVLHNFYERSYFPAPLSRSPFLCVGVSAALLVAAMHFSFRLRLDQRFSRYRPEQFFFFVPFILITLLLAFEMPGGLITVSWVLEGVIVFLFALWIKERTFRLTGLGLLLVSVGKIVLIDVWGLGPRDRYLSFIVLGSGLLLVSFLYTRHRESLRQYL